MLPMVALGETSVSWHRSDVKDGGIVQASKNKDADNCESFLPVQLQLPKIRYG